MKSILHLISPRSAEKKKEKDTDENDSYSDDDFEDGDEDFSSPVKTSRTENTEKGSILTTSVTPVTKEAGDDALNDFLNGLSSSSSSDEEEVESKTLTVKVLDKKKVEKKESPSPNIKKNPLPSRAHVKTVYVIFHISELNSLSLVMNTYVTLEPQGTNLPLRIYRKLKNY